MIRRLARKATDILICEDSVKEEDRGIYEFGIEQGAWMILNVATAGFLGWMTGEILACAVYLALYIPLRRYAGGYHAGNYMRCWAGSGMMVLAALLGIHYWQGPLWVSLSIMLCCAALIALCSPVETANHPLDGTETAAYKKEARKILFFQTGITVAATAAGVRVFLICAMFAYLSLACLMLLEMIRRKK